MTIMDHGGIQQQQQQQHKTSWGQPAELSEELLQHAVSDALVSLRKTVPVKGAGVINCLSGYGWWPGCENEHDKLGLKYDALLGAWHTEIAPWLGEMHEQAVRCKASAADDMVLTTPPSLGETLSAIAAAKQRCTLALDERYLMYDNPDALPTSRLLVDRYDWAARMADEQFREQMMQWRDWWMLGHPATGRPSEESVWGLKVEDDWTENDMQQRREPDIRFVVMRKIMARLTILQSLLPMTDCRVELVTIRVAPHDPNCVELFVLARVWTSPGLDRSLTVESLADEQMAYELNKRMVHYAHVINEVPGWEIAGVVERDQMCMHSVVRFERANVCPWCWKELPALAHPTVTVPQKTREQLEQEERQLELEEEAEWRQMQGREEKYQGEYTLDEIIMRIESWRESPQHVYNSLEERQQVLESLLEELDRLRLHYASRPPGELAGDGISCEDLRAHIEFWTSKHFPEHVPLEQQPASEPDDSGCSSGSSQMMVQ